MDSMDEGLLRMDIFLLTLFIYILFPTLEKWVSTLNWERNLQPTNSLCRNALMLPKSAPTSMKQHTTSNEDQSMRESKSSKPLRRSNEESLGRSAKEAWSWSEEWFRRMERGMNSDNSIIGLKFKKALSSSDSTSLFVAIKRRRNLSY